MVFVCFLEPNDFNLKDIVVVATDLTNAFADEDVSDDAIGE